MPRHTSTKTMRKFVGAVDHDGAAICRATKYIKKNWDSEENCLY